MLKRVAVYAAAVVLCLSAGAGAAQAQVTAPRPAHPAGPPRITMLNLHKQYLAQLHHVKLGKISGIVHPLGWHSARAAQVRANCTEPNCDLTYNGGPVQPNPHVFLVFWGPDWTAQLPQEASLRFLISFYTGRGTQPPDGWSPITAQYGGGSGFPAFTGTVLQDAVVDTSTPPAGATEAQLAAEANAWGAYFASNGYTINNDSQIVVATQSGTCPQGFSAPGVCPTSASPYCAWHSDSNEPFTNLPYILDAGGSCGENFVNSGNAGVYDGWSIVGGHEYAESITDPVPGTGWIDLGDGISGGEVADKCAWRGSGWGGGDPAGNVTLSTGTFAMQSLWSNAAGSCVMAATEDTVTVTNPGAQSTVTGDSVSLQMTGSASGSNPLQWYASGLPPGLSINSATGLITGTPATTGSYAAEVIASDDTGASSAQAFGWNVTADTVSVASPGAQTGYAHARVHLQLTGTSSGGFTPLTWSATGLPAGLKLSAATGLVTGAPSNAGNYPVTVTATDTANNSGSASFTWTVHADVGKPVKEISAGVCLNDANSIAAPGNPVTVAKCNGSGAQKWTFPTPGELTVFGLCLADYSYGGSGTKLSLEACRGYGNEVWSHKSNGEYVLHLNHLCLTDPKDAARNGIKVSITTCHDAKSQKWTKP